ncbi:hypothetical protein LCGC14_0535040 [marine sediment metagenome]|uniref:Rho-GAP domain-containing protein n=1 Tax=marine sediment metagenome TaxID=412755 RepID=A0A0F9UFW8_9ZZZZ
MPTNYFFKLKQYVEDQCKEGKLYVGIGDLESGIMKTLGIMNPKTISMYIESMEKTNLLQRVGEGRWRLMDEEAKIRKLEKEMDEKTEREKKEKERMGKETEEVDAKLDAYAKGKPE